MIGKVRFAFGVAMVWLVAVAGVSATAWVVIDRAGRNVTSADVSALPAPPLGVATTTPGGLPSRTDGPLDPSPSASATPDPLASTLATRRDGTVTVAGGQVSVRCVGANIALRIAQPSNGWRVEVEKSGPEEVDVGFRRGDGEAGGEGHVKGICSGGIPVFTTEES